MNKVDYVDWEILKGLRFYTCGKMDIKLHQKKEFRIIVGIQHIQSTIMSSGNSKDMLGQILKKSIFWVQRKILWTFTKWNTVKNSEHLVEEELISFLDHQFLVGIQVALTRMNADRLNTSSLNRVMVENGSGNYCFCALST